ncbi:MAG: DUF3810 domain-containing protein [Caldicoprobacterales bacterium]|jgi:hypothetical protein|nr:DUF3810 domain-containing protein [Clostridiales bacterium]
MSLQILRFDKMFKGLSKKYLLILLFPLGYLLNTLSRNNSVLTEKIYSNGIYRGISWLVGNILGWVPFSLAELLLPVLFIIIIWRMAAWVVRLIRKKGQRWIVLRNGVLNLLLIGSLVYFSFIFIWGLNYNRQSLADILGLEVRPSTVDELVEMTEVLLENTNRLRREVQEDEEGVVMLIGGASGAFARASKGYQAAAEYFPGFDRVYGRPKPLLFSSVIAYTNIWGIYSPFTAESNINMKIPAPMLPSTLMHEQAHQLGFAREDEANYISYLTCSFHPDADFRYSGSLSALNYSLNAVYRQDREAWQDLYSRLSDGIKRDLAENAKYHAKYDGPIREATSKTNDAYLKANNQKDGERSYGRMVDLLLAQYRYEKQNNE